MATFSRGEIRLLTSVAMAGTGAQVIAGKALGAFDEALLYMVASVAGGAGTDTLDLWLQKTAKGSGTPPWTDFVHFTQAVGNVAASLECYAEVNGIIVPTTAVHALSQKALAAGVSHGPWGDTWNAAWTVAGGKTWTVDVYGYFK